MAAANDPSTSAAAEGQSPTLPADATGIQTTPPAANATGIQAEAPPADTTRIPLPPPVKPRRREMRPETVVRLITRLDRAMVGVVLVLAFLAASFGIHNTDFWMHLATGRLLAEGKYTFGVDPFSYTVKGVYWANHAWLYDLILYGLYQVAGGTGLVIVKALMITALAEVMMRIRRPGQSLWLPAACTGLAILAMTPRLFLQPICVSLFFLGVTLFLLQWRRAEPKEERRPARVTPRGGLASLSPWWLLPPLFALWVNLDSWFFLGPLTVGLYLLGEYLQDTLAPVHSGPDAPRPGERRTLALVLAAGVAACLLSPHHYHAFSLPAQLSFDTADVLKQDRLFEILFTSPLEADYFRPFVGLSVAGIAYYPLLALGLVSFAVNSSGWRWWRALVWLAFALLGCYSARLIPLFAVVAGPIAVFNIQDAVARRFGTTPQTDERWRQWSLGGRAVTLVLGLVLLALAWPGWLAATPGYPQSFRQTAWTLEPDVSLQRAAEQLHAWHQEGKLTEADHGFNFMPDQANYYAWFCPEEKGFFDHRFELFGEIAKSFVDVRGALRGLSAPAEGKAQPGSSGDAVWQEIFRKRDVNHVVLNGGGPGSMPAVYRYLASRPDQWKLLYLNDRTAVFGWKKAGRPASGEAFAGLGVDLERRAFGPEAYTAPEQGPGRAARRLNAWELYRHGQPPQPPEADTAGMYLSYFQAGTRLRQDEHVRVFQSLTTAQVPGLTVVGTVGMGGVGGAVMTLSGVRNWALISPEIFNDFLSGRDDGPPALALLAVRAARRACAASPDCADGYYQLAQAYTTLGAYTRERQWTERMKTLKDLRRTQEIVALQQALTLQPANGDLQVRLASMYERMNYVDLALEHWEALFKQAQANGPQPGQREEDFTHELANLEKKVKDLEAEVKKRRNRYDVSAVNQLPLNKAQRALDQGLVEQALQALLDSDAVQFGAAGALLELELLLITGRLDRWESSQHEYVGVLELLDTEDLKEQLGAEYTWFAARLAAALGDYEKADKHLEEMAQRAEQDAAGVQAYLQKFLPPWLGTVFMETPLPKPVAYWVSHFLQTQPVRDQRLIDQLYRYAQTQQNQADWATLRGVLALERGDTAAATGHFRAALTRALPGEHYLPYLAVLASGSPAEASASLAAAHQASRKLVFDFSGRPIAQRYLELIQEAK